MSATPRRSSDSVGCGLSFGSARSAYTAATRPIGTLMRKIQCQLALWISQPPRIGPAIGPSSMGTPRIAMRRPIRFGPAALVMIVIPSGMSMPPPRPWSTRKLMSMPIEVAAAHSAEPAVKRTSAST